MIDIFEAFSIYTTQESGIVILAVLGFVEFIIKPIMSRYMNGKRQLDVTKKVLLPLLVCFLSMLGCIIISPPSLVTIPAKLLFGFSLGIVANFLYRVGLSSIMKKLGLEEKMGNSIFPPKNE